jgi:DNA-binding Xre family transcriptional regulator
MSLKSKTSIARPKSWSLRATVLEGICVFLNLSSGDTLEWQMTDTPDGRVASVRKI